MQVADVGMYVPADADRSTLIKTTRALDERGYHSIWFTEVDLMRDPFVHAAAAAMLTDRLHVGIGLVNVWKQLPTALATAAATLADLTPGGVSLVIGPWHEPAATQAGVSRHDVVQSMRETTTIIRALLAGESVTQDGVVHRVEGVQMPNRDGAASVELLWGANGPRMVAAAGEMAGRGLIDGVMINYLTPVDRVAEITRAVRAGSEAAGRDPDELRFPVVLWVLRSDDVAAEVEQLRAFIEANPGLRAEARFPDGPVTWDEVGSRVVAGNAEECRRRIAEFRDAGTEPVLYSRDPLSIMNRLFDRD